MNFNDENLTHTKRINVNKGIISIKNSLIQTCNILFVKLLRTLPITLIITASETNWLALLVKLLRTLPVTLVITASETNWLVLFRNYYKH